MGSCAAPSAKGDDKFITTDYLQQCRSQLEMLLGPTDCSRLSLLESLKKGPVTISGPAFNEAIERWK
ncbi:hypothetical protein KC844_20145, partial [Proteus mirabilis]|uniref:hypothetical protein n=1 Tax=Proteus mirabilis TaxID=584 RepID=UPI0033148F25